MNPPPHSPPESFPVKVLVVDDDESQRYFIQKSLALRGFSVIAVAEAKDALALCASAPPDVIIVDWCLSRNSLSGIGILKALRSQETAKNILFIMMSSIKGSSEDEALVRRLGGDLFLTKFEIMDLGRPGQAFSRHVRALVLSRRQAASENMPKPQQHGGPVHHDGLELDRGNHSVRFNGKSCKLPDDLFDLFCSLASSQPHPLEHGGPDGRDHELDAQVSRLRAKLEEAFGRDLLDEDPPRH